MAIKERLHIWRVTTLWGWWKVLSGISFLAGVYDLIRGESSLTLPSLQNLISWWDWKVWLLIAFIILLVATMEGSYRFVRKVKSELEVDCTPGVGQMGLGKFGRLLPVPAD